ncbi:MAG TPA: 2-C-methyl-D-erythritol 4-phosphate cytidylyltransferase [Porticoccaceae bacterium]|nr:2-C-methyl-D-erythritol 4-phosphate cytidylyltransferase [Porticoccaceae bacterium]HIK79776.1 2-C-methyl-D-erythritol 4-phosphate cytidylyltransferase [Porticoccaceae bacterium]
MMKPSSNYWAIVPAAGVGRRFSADIPKQFHQLHGELVAQHTLSRLLSITGIKRIVAPCDPSSGYWSRVRATSNSRVQLIQGGETRARSVLNGLVAIQQDASPDDWVLVHDMARPCVTRMDINKLIGNLEEHPVGGFLAAPINETLKLVTSDNKVTKTVDRNQYRIAQTPQMFRARMLQEAIQSMFDNQLEPTDEASAIEYIGEQAMVIDGRQDNIKITRREDLMIAEAILQDQEKQGCG